MGKRFLLTLISLFVFAGSAFAYGYPRWFTMPITVYMPKQEESVIVTNAFKNWQKGTKSSVRFMFRYSKNLASISNINVIYVNHVLGDKPYKVSHSMAQLGGCRGCGNRFYNNADIYISTVGEDGVAYTPEKLEAIAMQAIGRVIGLRLNNNASSVMYLNSTFTETSVTQDAYDAVIDLYKPSHARH